MSDITNDTEYYTSYYDRMGTNAYLGEGVKHTSRILTICEWLRSYLKPGDKVLDIGCGDGILAKLCPEFTWYGQDININRASIFDKDKVIVQDSMVTPYPWETGFFNAVVTMEHLEHIWDLRVVHKDVKRILNRNGTYIISTPNFNWITNLLEHHQRILQARDNHWAWEHVRHYTYDTHKMFLNDAGFVIDKHVGSDAHYCPVFANACRGILEGLKRNGIDVNEASLHQWVGEALPTLQHTVVVSCKKV